MSEFDCIIQIETVKNVQTIKGGERMLLEERLDEEVYLIKNWSRCLVHLNRQSDEI